MARLSSYAQDKVLDATYPNHLKDIAPIFKINPQKELEIIANKYRLQAQKMNECASTQLNSINKSKNSKALTTRSVSVKNDRRVQNIAGDSALASDFGPVSGKGSDFFNRVPGANLQSTLR